MREIVENILIEILELEDNVNAVLSQEENAEWDSLKHLEIVMALEEEFNIRFSAEEIKLLIDIESIMSYLQDKVK